MKYEINKMATFSLGMGIMYFIDYIVKNPFAATIGFVVFLLFAVLAGISDE